MHLSSFENMQKCYRRYVAGGYLDGRDNVRVLDVGGADVNGSYSEIFPPPQFEYLGADLQAGEGVAVVLEDPYKLPFPDASLDLVISGQTFEHNEYFWLTFAEMVRVVKDDGYVFLIAPSAGPIHRYPVDCYRFYPDSFRALAKFAHCAALDVWHDQRGPWNDLVGVFNKTGDHPYPPGPPDLGALKSASPPKAASGKAKDDASERAQGAVSTHELLKRLHEALQPRRYLEIGVGEGRSLALASCEAVGVDPAAETSASPAENARIVSETSDAFFEVGKDPILKKKPDLVLIDGMHRVEYALRDFMHVERIAGPDTVVAITNVLPNAPVQAERERQTDVWAGDVWKLHRILREERRDLVLAPVDTSPTGLLLVAGLNPKSNRLWARYNRVAERAIRDEQPPGPDVLERQGVIAPESPEFAAFVDALAAARAKKRPLAGERKRLLAALAGK